MTTPNQSSQPTPENTADIHKVDDVDTSATAHHHTLGFSVVQAAPGNHRHDGTDGSATLGSYAALAHGHPQGDIDSLISDLASKASNADLATKYSATNKPPANNVTFDNAGTDLVATQVQAAIVALDARSIKDLPVAVSGDRSTGQALENLLTALESVGIITDNTVA